MSERKRGASMMDDTPKPRPRVLFVAPVEPWCRENGSSLITADILDSLVSLDEVDLLPIFVRRPPPGYERRPPDGVEGVLLDIPGLPRWLSVVKSAVLASSPLRHRFDNERVTGAILDLMRSRSFEPDLIHVEHLPLVDIGLATSRATGGPVVYRAHNVESRLWARRLGLPGPFKRPVVAHMEREEADAIRSVDMTLCISHGDLEWARARAPGATAELLPCTLKLQRYDDVPRSDPLFSSQIAFVGGLDWAPNEDGLRWFVEHVLPRISKMVPDAGLAVLARGAEDRPWLQDLPSVRLLPSESSAPELFASSHVSIAPLFQGGGVRIKIAESLALQCPVVATTIGAEGHDVRGVSCTDDPIQFADACVDYLRAKSGDESTTNLREDVEAAYGASTHAKGLVALWARLMKGRSGAPRVAGS